MSEKLFESLRILRDQMNSGEVTLPAATEALTEIVQTFDPPADAAAPEEQTAETEPPPANTEQAENPAGIEPAAAAPEEKKSKR